jgi:hypothetical protein
VNVSTMMTGRSFDIPARLTIQMTAAVAGRSCL